MALHQAHPYKLLASSSQFQRAALPPARMSAAGAWSKGTCLPSSPVLSIPKRAVAAADTKRSSCSGPGPSLGAPPPQPMGSAVNWSVRAPEND